MNQRKMKSRFKLLWDTKALASALQIHEHDVTEYFTDGRRVSFIIERRLENEHDGWTRATSEGASFDLIDPTGGKWEVRSLTRNGVYFTPSSQVGSGRKFDEKDFLAKLSDIEGFILADIETFPSIEVYVVPVKNVRRWYTSNVLGKTAKISRKKFLKNCSDDIEQD